MAQLRTSDGTTFLSRSRDSLDRFTGSYPARFAIMVFAAMNLLFMLPFLWAFSAFFRDPAGMVQHLGVFAVLMFAAWMTREGVIAQDAYDQRRVARRPAIPRKIFGSVAMGLGLALAGFGAEGGIAVPVIFGALGAVLHFLSFGPDPLRDKGMSGVDEFQTDRVARAVEGAEAYLASMSDAMLRARDRKLDDRLKEWSSGDWSGMLYADIAVERPDEWAAWTADQYGYRPPNGENFQDLEVRANSFLADAAEHDAQTVAVFAHGFIIRVTVGQLAGLTPDDVLSVKQANDVVIRVRETEDGKVIDHFIAGNGPHAGLPRGDQGAA